jgi:tetratricopeptide (TPR) repeat protein
VYNSQGKYKDAYEQYEQGLRIQEKAFGVDHIKLVDTIGSLGNAYANDGKYGVAIEQYKRVLRIQETAFGVDHINMVYHINNLADTYNREDICDEAMIQYERALRIIESTGQDHPIAACVHDKLALALMKRFQVSRIGSDLETIFMHFQLGVLTASEQDPVLDALRIKRLGALLELVRMQNRGQGDKEGLLEVRTLPTLF